MKSSGGYQSAGLRRRQFARKVKWYIGVSSALLFIIAAAYVVVASGLFEVREIQIIGAPADQRERILDTLKPQVVATRVGGILGADNYFAWSDSLTYEDVRSNRVSVAKSFWGRTVTITVHPRARYGIWCADGGDGTIGCDWIDEQGIAFEPAPIPEGQLVIALFDSASGTVPILGEPVISSNYFKVIQAVAESLPKLHLPVSQIVVDRALEEVRLQTLSGTTISFSLRFDPTTAALPALKKLIDSPGLAGMRTVDFTVENRVFYTAK